MNHPTQEQFEAALTEKGFVKPPRIVQFQMYRQTAYDGSFCDLVTVLDEGGTMWTRKDGTDQWSQEPGLDLRRSEPPAERRDCDEMPLGVPRG